MPDLTLEQLQAMPDRELDAMAARLVMKWKYWTEQSPDVGFAEHPSAECIIYYQHSCTEVYSVLVRRGAGSMEFRPSTDLSAAFELVKALNASGWFFQLSQLLHTNDYRAEFVRHWVTAWASDPSPARAITMAAILTTVEGK